MGYRLGAIPSVHGMGDCLSLACAVLTWYGIEVPMPKRDWYRRLRRGDRSVFHEELNAWGRRTNTATIGTIGLTPTGLTTFYEGGWLYYSPEKQVAWTPLELLTDVELYCPRK